MTKSLLEFIMLKITVFEARDVWYDYINYLILLSLTGSALTLN